MGFEPEWTIGSLQGDPAFALGRVRHVAMDPAGRIALADALGPRIHVYGPDGAHIASAGRAGDGPGEFRAPESVAWGPDGRIWVGDRSGRITSFGLVDGSLEPERTLSIRGTVFDLCVLPPDLVVHAFAVGDTAVLRVLSTDGEERGAFGGFHAGPDLIAQETFSWGFVACFPALGRLVYVAEYSPEVRAYSSDGSLVWTDSIPGYRQIPTFERRPGLRGFLWAPPEGAHRTISLFQVASELAALQVALRDSSSTEGRDYQGIRTFAGTSRPASVCSRRRNGPNWLCSATVPPSDSRTCPIPASRGIGS